MLQCIIKSVSEGESGDADATPPQETSSTKHFNSLTGVFDLGESPNSARHVVIVMDALKGFSREPLQWVLDHIMSSSYTITLLGVMPYVPLALSCKPKDVWTYDPGHLGAIKARGEWKNDHKYLKIQKIIELCERKGVVPYMKVAVGHPLRLVILEQTSNLHANLVVLDRSLRKNRSFFAERLPGNAVMMNRHRGVDMLRSQSTIEYGGDSISGTPRESPALCCHPRFILSEQPSGRLSCKSTKQQPMSMTRGQYSFRESLTFLEYMRSIDMKL